MNIHVSKKPRLQVARRLLHLLTARERAQLLGVVVMAVINVCLETVGFGIVFAVSAAVVGDDSFGSSGIVPEFLEARGRVGTAVFMMGSLVAIFALKHALTLVFAWFQFGLLNRIGARVSHHLFSVLLAKPFGFFGRYGTPDLIVRSQSAGLIGSGIIGPSLTLFVDVLVGLALLGLLLTVDPISTAIIGILFALFGLTFYRSFRARLATWGTDQVEARTRSLRLLQDGFQGVKELRILGRQDAILSQYRRTYDRLGRLNQLFLSAQSVPRSVLELLSIVGISLMIVGQTVRGERGTEILPVVALFAAGAFRIAPSVNRVLTAIQQVQFSVPALAQIMDDLTSPSPDTSRRKISGPQMRFESLIFENVSFCHEDSNASVIEDFSLEIRRGESLGVFGESGVGKSTLVDLALGLLTPTKGQIFLNGLPLSQQLAEWHAIVGYVPQSVFVIDDSIRANVALGLTPEEVDDRLVRRALRAAQLEDFVNGLPSNLDTVVGERGARVSGGQLQRLGIARALYHVPEVLFLDEATSALDPETEDSLLDEIDQIREHATLVFVTHRSSSLRVCSRTVKLSRYRSKSETAPFLDSKRRDT